MAPPDPAGRPGHDGPLAGVRIADFTWALAGPFATMTLGDLGADVVKVESVQGGDDTRTWGPPFPDGESAYYLCAKRDKRSLALDLRSEVGREVARRLIAESDVVVHSLRSGSAAKFGLSYDDVRRTRPDVVYCGISGYGEASDRPGHDHILQAVGGLMSITGQPTGEPMKVGIALTDLFTCLYAVTGARRRWPSGQAAAAGSRSTWSCTTARWRCSQTWRSTPSSPVWTRLDSATPTPRSSRTSWSTPRTGHRRGGGQRPAGPRVLRRPRPTGARRRPRVRHERPTGHLRDRLVPLLEGLVRERYRDNLTARLEERIVPVGPVRTAVQALESEETAAREMVWQVQPPLLGSVPLVASPVKLDRTPPLARRHPPLLGEHTVEVLDELGYAADGVARLVADRVVAVAAPAGG